MCLTVVFVTVSLGAGAGLSALLAERTGAGEIMRLIGENLQPVDHLVVLAKTLVPGLLMAAISCHEGLSACGQRDGGAARRDRRRRPVAGGRLRLGLARDGAGLRRMTAVLEIAGLTLEGRAGAGWCGTSTSSSSPASGSSSGGRWRLTSGMLRGGDGARDAGSRDGPAPRRGAAALPKPRAEALLARMGYSASEGALVSNLPLRDNLLLPLRYHRRLGSTEVPEAA